MGNRGPKGLVGLLAIALLATGCSSGNGNGNGNGSGSGAEGDGGGSAVIEVDRPTALVDESIRIRVTGLRAGEKVTVGSESDDVNGTWRGKAAFTADPKGVVDLTEAQPASGTYRTVDGMGLFWSMAPPPGADAAKRSFELSHPDKQRSYTVRLTVASDRGTVAEREVTRVRMADGVRSRALFAGRDKVSGRIYEPPEGAPERAPVLIFGGSEGGGFSTRADAALLASRGHPTLSLCYFGCDGLPERLANIPLEYFAAAARLAAEQPWAKPGGVVAIGTSRGTEPAQLLAQHYPDLVRDVVLYAPSDRIEGGFPEYGKPAWTRGGKPLVTKSLIPYDRVRGTVLAIAGGDDTLWDTREFSKSIAARRDTREPHRALIHDEAGHAVGSYPHMPRSTFTWADDLQDFYSLGGARPADARARAETWPEVLTLLGR
ncbi:acyl-CoA thioesterase/bile acid-CoA:amino acid N-acyltransferase family protein [Streptomyces sp. NPDC014894]|uniref:acyl-CoA thioesterase/bile acid-CoA:amino acid N-acyltransferase family protein n=1 Tax=Streptomyces sp. NPDC014894 TaxID=3364931 RepID=UPI0036FB025D